MPFEELRRAIRGNIVPLPAQFNDDLSLNFDGYKKHIAFLLEKGVKNIYLALSASEYEYMTYEERIKVTEFVVKEVKGKAVVLAQPVGGGCVEDFITETKAMVDCGADAFVIKPIPLKTDQKFFSTFYRKRTYTSNKKNINESYFNFYEQIAKTTGAAIVFHDKPFCSFEQIDQVLAIDNIIGYKSHEITPWIRREIYGRYGNRVVCFDGLGKTDQLWSLLWGAKARHTCWSWFDPERDQRFVDFINSGNINEAITLVNEEWGFVDAILSTGFHGYKVAMELLGLPSGPVRVPGGQIDQQGRDMIKNAMAEMGYFDQSGLLLRS